MRTIDINLVMITQRESIDIIIDLIKLTYQFKFDLLCQAK